VTLNSTHAPLLIAPLSSVAAVVRGGRVLQVRPVSSQSLPAV
jgi:hypothetical protein